MATKAVAPVKKTAAKKPPAKKTAANKPSTPRQKPPTIQHPFGTCVPLGECICNTKGVK